MEPLPALALASTTYVSYCGGPSLSSVAYTRSFSKEMHSFIFPTEIVHLGFGLSLL